MNKFLSKVPESKVSASVAMDYRIITRKEIQWYVQSRISDRLGTRAVANLASEQEYFGSGTDILGKMDSTIKQISLTDLYCKIENIHLKV